MFWPFLVRFDWPIWCRIENAIFLLFFVLDWHISLLSFPDQRNRKNEKEKEREREKASKEEKRRVKGRELR